MSISLTLGSTFYNNPENLTEFVNTHQDFVDEIIIVDDGSPRTITDYLLPSSKIRLFRVKKDYGFNSHGCRNLIMTKARHDWVVLIDLDRKFIWPKDAFNQIRSVNLQNNTLYRFSCHNGWDDTHVSVNDYLIHKKHFFSAGGYDEEIIGQRWGDREYFEQLSHFGKERVLPGVDLMFTRIASSYLNIASVHDVGEVSKDLQKLIRRRIRKPEPNKPILTFDWEEIT